jgi:hypothetical protein
LKILGGTAAAAVAAPLITPASAAPLYIPSQNLDMGVPRQILTATDMSLAEWLIPDADYDICTVPVPMLLVHDEFRPPGWQQYGQQRVPAGTTLLVDRPTAERWVTHGVGTPGPGAPLALQEASAKRQASRWLEPLVTEDWSSGVGMAYDAAPGFDTFASPGYVLPTRVMIARNAERAAQREANWSRLVERDSARLKRSEASAWWDSISAFSPFGTDHGGDDATT